MLLVTTTYYYYHFQSMITAFMLLKRKFRYVELFELSLVFVLLKEEATRVPHSSRLLHSTGAQKKDFHSVWILFFFLLIIHFFLFFFKDNRFSWENIRNLWRLFLKKKFYLISFLVVELRSRIIWQYSEILHF